MGNRLPDTAMSDDDVVVQNSMQQQRNPMTADVVQLHYAVMGNNIQSVQSSIDAKVDVNAPWINPSNPTIKDGSTPLICAVSLNFVNIVKILLAAGAQVNGTDHQGNTPLLKAAFHGRHHLIKLLIDAGADHERSNQAGQTPLSICVQHFTIHSSPECIQLLLQHKANIQIRNENGLSLLHLAALHGKSAKLSELLITVNCDPDCIDKWGRTPLYICMSTLSMALYREDLRLQLPFVRTLFIAGCDMLNFSEWTLWKGSGIPPELCINADNDENDGNAFMMWYVDQCNSPLSLKNQSRKVIQEVLLINGQIFLPEIVQKFTIPVSLQKYLSRKLCHGMTMSIELS